VPERLPPEAEAVLRAVAWRHSRAADPPARWFETLTDPPSCGPIREEVRAAVRAALAG
jgi:acetoin utilization protein AcuC